METSTRRKSQALRLQAIPVLGRSLPLLRKLDLLARSIEEVEATAEALAASTQEIKQDWNI